MYSKKADVFALDEQFSMRHFAEVISIVEIELDFSIYESKGTETIVVASVGAESKVKTIKKK